MFASQFSLSVPTNEDLYVSELARETPALAETFNDMIFKQHDFQQPVTMHAEAVIGQFSLQSIPDEKMECSLAGYWCPEANVSNYQFYFQGFLLCSTKVFMFPTRRASAEEDIAEKSSMFVCVCIVNTTVWGIRVKGS
ncbi:unnamed protein product [Gongylonema pulchrum]|uniref:Vanin_C domain-containing protein n=1 Tax=Gongylonema pulchrum TaxID=637853 RepID=A0A183EYA5_9BILA|nr:unnamed protein product [Gongylonema pulchrum]